MLMFCIITAFRTSNRREKEDIYRVKHEGKQVVEENM